MKFYEIYDELIKKINTSGNMKYLKPVSIKFIKNKNYPTYAYQIEHSEEYGNSLCIFIKCNGEYLHFKRYNFDEFAFSVYFCISEDDYKIVDSFENELKKETNGNKFILCSKPRSLSSAIYDCMHNHELSGCGLTRKEWNMKTVYHLEYDKDNFDVINIIIKCTKTGFNYATQSIYWKDALAEDWVLCKEVK